MLISAITNSDSTLAARGDEIKKTTKQLAAGKRTTITPRLKHPKQLKEKTPLRVKITLTATDEFGQTATEEIKVKLVGHGVNPI